MENIKLLFQHRRREQLIGTRALKQKQETIKVQKGFLGL